MSNTQPLLTAPVKPLTVARFWLHESRLGDPGARVELSDGTQHVVTVSEGGTIDGIPHIPALQAIRDAIQASVVPHAALTNDDAWPRCEGWDAHWDDANHKADLHWDAMHRAEAV